MSTDLLLERVRAANPAPTKTIADDELFARIVAAPGDPRLAAEGKPRRRRRRMGTRGLALIAAAVVLSAGGGAFAAVQLGLTHASPKKLFEADPQGQFSRRPGHFGGTGQTVVPQSVRRATTFTVPGDGRFEFWIAISQPKGWLCTAIRQPDGTWADVEAPHDKYQIGGPVPGCGTLPWRDAHHFSYYPSYVDAPAHRIWRLVYGYAPATGHPVQIRDRISGVTAPIGDGRYFAIVIPYCQGRGCNRPAPFAWFQLQTLDASGRVLVTDARDAGM
jgi:hypothetical protein